MQKFLILFLLMAAPIFAQTDGPATLPQSVPVQTWTSPNPAKIVGPSDNLQLAINAAVAGDLLLVDPANVTNGPIVGPCNLGALGITVQGNVIGLPAAGHRVGPGLQMPKIILTGSQSVANGCNFALIGFEVARTLGGIAYNLINPTSAAHDVIYDRLYVHGTPTDETTRGIMLHGHNISVVNSYFSDFHCFSQIGACTDAQAIAGGLNDAPTDGAYLIRNNYLEASGENILFGGGADTVTPCDITIQDNDLTKQLSSNPNDPSFVLPLNGHPYVSKNLLEFKNVCRVLVDGDRLSNSWGGFSQAGFAILVTPKNQNNQCPLCVVHDVTIRNTHVSHTAGAMQIGFGPSDAGGWPLGAYNYSIHDVDFTDLQCSTCTPGTHWVMQISTGNNNGAVMNSVWIDHISLLNEYKWLPPFNSNDGSGHGILLVTAPTTAPFPFNMRLTNSLMESGTYPIYTTGGGSTNCANAYVFNNYTGFFANCWSNAVVTGNTILQYGAFGQLAQIPWPAGNFVVKSGAPQ